MTLAATMRALRAELDEAMAAFETLRLAVVEDRPAGGDLAFVEQRANAIDDAYGWLHEAAEALAGAPVWSVGDARAAVALCHARMLDVGRRVGEGLTAYERLGEIEAAARARGRGWIPWLQGVRLALHDCVAREQRVNRQLLACWQELTERLTATPAGAPAAAAPAARSATHCAMEGDV